MEVLENRRMVASLISVAILSLLFLAGPVEAFILGLQIDNIIPNKGDNVTFIASIDIGNVNKFVPINNLSLIITGPSPQINAHICIFDVNGNNLSGCDGITIIQMQSSHPYEHGYDYGYGHNYGYSYGYDYGYDYGYGYGYGYGSSKTTLKYKIVLNTENYSEGIYDNILQVKIGADLLEKNGPQITIKNISTWTEEPIKPIKTFSTYRSSFVAPLLNLSSPDNTGNPNNNNNAVLNISSDKAPRGKIPSLFSGITGAVIGALNHPKSTGAGLFILTILGGMGIVSYKRKRKTLV